MIDASRNVIFGNVALQVGTLQCSTIQGDTRYRNTYEGLTSIVRNQGWRQLFAGLSINYIKVFYVVLNNNIKHSF